MSLAARRIVGELEEGMGDDKERNSLLAFAEMLENAQKETDDRTHSPILIDGSLYEPDWEEFIPKVTATSLAKRAVGNSGS